MNGTSSGLPREFIKGQAQVYLRIYQRTSRGLLKGQDLIYLGNLSKGICKLWSTEEIYQRMVYQGRYQRAFGRWGLLGNFVKTCHGLHWEFIRGQNLVYSKHLSIFCRNLSKGRLWSGKRIYERASSGLLYLLITQIVPITEGYLEFL